MPSLQKRHNREVRESAEYISQSRKWIVLIFLLAIITGVVASEVFTRGKISPYYDGGWLTFLVHEIVQAIRNLVSGFAEMLKEAVETLRF